MATPPKVLPQADGAQLIALFNAGRYRDLEKRARQLSAVYPASGFVWKVLGTALLVQGKDGVEALRKAVELMPTDVETLSNLGNAQKAVGQLQAAAASYRRAVEIRPDYVAGHYNLGIVLKELGQAEAAVAAYRQAIALLPGFVEAHYNLGLAMQDLGEPDAAEQAYRQALSLKPDYPEAHYNLGLTLQQAGRADEALRCLEQAVALRPDYADAWCNLGVVQAALGQPESAQRSYRQALALQPALAAAHNNLGNVLKDLCQYDEALRCFEQALRIAPRFADALNNLGNTLKELGRLSEAQARYREALALQPDDTDAMSNLLFISNYLAGQAPDALLDLARAYGEIVARRATPWTQWPNTLEPDRPLRIGLVSGDLCAHPVAYFLEGVLGALQARAADRLSVWAYATQPRHDAVSDRLRALCAGWRQVAGLSDHDLAERIRADGIDLLIDLSGHTGHTRLPMFAWRPAPVQLSWLGYFATTGVAAIDYCLVDPWTAPADTPECFTETLWHLPETRLCFTPPQDSPPVGPLPALQQGQLTFGCFNNLTKVNEAVVSLWARVLQAVPGSRLLLKAEQLDDAAVATQVRARFAAAGIDAARLILRGRSPRAAYLATYDEIDIALDPFPFTGGTTSAESLWMGVPVLTLAGQSVVSRQGVGLLMNAGLPDWVAQDADDYVAKAASHARDLPALAALRAGLRAQVQASPVFDAPRFAQHLEAALRAMWQRWCHEQRAV